MIMPASETRNAILEDHTKLVLACDRLNKFEKFYLAGILSQVHHLEMKPVAIWRDMRRLYFEYVDKNKYYWRIHFNEKNILFPKFPSKCSDSVLAEKYHPEQILIKFFDELEAE